MTAVLILAALLAADRVYSLIERRQWTKERARLVNAVIARHPGELAMLNRDPKPRPATVEPDPGRPALIGGE